MNASRWMVAAAVVAGVIFRLAYLDNRTMHTDEAVHAVKFGRLLEAGEYRYDKNEYHGPVLNYLTLLPARLLSRTTLAAVDENVLRSVPALIGIILIPLPLLLGGFRKGSAAMAVALTAVSPAMVFYSRYYIQEMLLVSFTFCLLVFGYLFLTTSRLSWALGTGAAAGLMHATKETSLIAFAVIGVVGVSLLILRDRTGRAMPRVSKRAILVALGAACGTSILFYSSFFSNWAGVLESIQAYPMYFERAGNGAHIHPWYYYIQVLTGWNEAGGLFWNESPILVFGVVGVVTTIRRWRNGGGQGVDLAMFLALYAILMFVIYSAIPYKTPWSILGSLHGIILMAGVGIVETVEYVRQFHWHWIVSVLMVGMFVSLAVEAYRASFVLFDQPANPYVYAQSTNDVKLLSEKIASLSNETPGGLPVQVVCSGDDYWPLPWYLRGLSSVGWWNSIPGDFSKTPIIVVSPDMEQALLKVLYDAPPPGKRELYVPLFKRPIFLRPGKEIRAFVTLDLSARSGGMED